MRQLMRLGCGLTLGLALGACGPSMIIGSTSDAGTDESDGRNGDDEPDVDAMVEPKPTCASIDARIDGMSYGTLATFGDKASRVEDSYDINPNLRGWSSSGGALTLVDINGLTDAKAPKLDTIFADDRMPQFSASYSIHHWDTDADRPGSAVDNPEVTLIGMRATPGDVVVVPSGGYRIGQDDQQVRVLYVGEDTITLQYTLDDSIAFGYAMHLVGVCAEPSLRDLYEESHQNGRDVLPALRGDQPLGVAPDR